MFRSRRRLVIGLVSALGPIVGPWVPAATAAEDPPRVEVRIDSFTPVAPKPDDSVTIAGTVRNTSDVTLEDTQALACIDQTRLTEKDEIRAVAAEADEHPSNYRTCEGLQHTNAYQRFEQPLKPGDSIQFKIQVQWQDWGINRSNAVYVVGILFRGDPDSGEPRITAGRSRTLMPVITPGPDLGEVRTAVVLPLQHRPTHLAGQIFADESLGQEMLPGGRLGRLLELGKRRSVTWLIDPAMLEEARRIAEPGGYQVLTPTKELRPGGYRTVATNWLNGLTSTTAKNPIIQLPFGDPDIAGLVDAGLSGLVGQARTLATAESRREHQPASSGVWLEHGSATGQTLATAATAHKDRARQEYTLVSNWAWTSAQRPALGPSPVVDVGTPAGPVRALVVDAGLTAGGPDPGAAPVQLRQRFASETALLAAAGKPVSVIAVPPRGFDPAGTGTGVLLQAMDLPWIAPTSVRAVAAGPARFVPAPDADRGTDTLPPRVRELDRAVTAYGALVDQSPVAITSPRLGLLRSASTQWRRDPVAAQRFISFQLGTVQGQLHRVRLVIASNGNGHQPHKVTLSGNKGQFPLTIINDLDESVWVGLRVTPLNRSDLRIEPFRLVKVGPHQKATFQVKASAQANGLIRAEAQVVAKDGSAVGPPQQLAIQAAQYGSVGWFLVGGAIMLLFGTSFLRIYRRIQGERRTEAPAPRTATGVSR